MAGWPKMPHGTVVGLGPGDFVFDGDLARASLIAQFVISRITNFLRESPDLSRSVHCFKYVRCRRAYRQMLIDAHRLSAVV